MITTATISLLSTLVLVPQALPAAQSASSTGYSVTDPPGAAAPVDCALHATGRGYEYRGTGTSMPAIFADDGVPAPNPAVVEAAATGDRVVQAASGDPDYLGFTAGPYFPPAGELIDPELLPHLQTSYADGRPSDETYAFVMFAKRMTPARLTQLEDVGCRLLGYHPYYTQKVALAPSAIANVASLDFVRWIGAPKSWQKVDPRLLEELAQTPAGKTVDVYVNVYDSDLGSQSAFINVGVAHEAAPDTGIVEGKYDERIGQVWTSNGWQQRALERLGLEVTEYVDTVRAFRAHMAPALLEQLIAQDYVQFVEPDMPNELAHDESMPMVLADYSRIGYSGSWSGQAMAGVIDSGLQIFHEALIPHVYIGWDVTPEGFAYLDNCGHGSHVSGTIWGAPPAADAAFTGMAPGLGFSAARRARVVKSFSGSGCTSAGISDATLYSYMHSNYSDGTNVSPPPHAINCSWGIAGGAAPWTGTDISSRTLDAEVYLYNQLYVFAAGNEGPSPSTLRTPACAKDAFTVGSVNDYFNSGDGGDPGNLSGYSSRGPCGDGRWKPNVVAPGSSIHSVNALGSNTSYVDKSGTSMAAPHVTGFAAMLADSDATLRYRPEMMSSLMMVTAMTHNDVVLTAPSDAHLNTYGTGLINTQMPLYGAPNMACAAWGFTQNSGTWQYGDFTVNSGCRRLIVCMTYNEIGASAGASHALINNFDLYIDSPANGGIDPAGNVGEFFVQQSTVDNTEIRIIDSPFVGNWRWKTWPTSTSGSVKMSIALMFVYANTKPNGSLTVNVSDAYVRPLELVDITATPYNPECFAHNVYLDSTSTCVLNSAKVSLFDGAQADLLHNAQGGRDVLLGLIGPGYTRSVDWQVFWTSNGVQNFQVDARSDNWINKSATVQVTVDGIAPVGPTNLTSATHPLGVQMCANNVAVTWTAATDSLSGIDQYVVLFDHASGTVPTLATPGAQSVAASVTGMNAYLTPDVNGYYCHLCALDRCGNYGTTAHYGPFFVHGVDVSTYCTGKINSQFCIPSIGSTGTPQISGNNFTVTCANAINNKNGLLFWGRQPQATPFQGGTLCIQSPVQRTGSIPSGGTSGASNCTGTYAFTFTQSYINSHGLHAGDDVYCQWWMRDPNVNSTTGLSNALRFVLCQ